MGRSPSKRGCVWCNVMRTLMICTAYVDGVYDHPPTRSNGICFGADVTTRFLDENKLKMLVRSHEVKDNGYEMDVGGRLCTVFSAPNYMDQVCSCSVLVINHHHVV
jgi:hypothetical protein